MRRDLIRTMGLALLIGMMMPVGTVLAAGTYRQRVVTPSASSWQQSEEATNLLNQIQTLAAKTTREVAPIQVQEQQTAWEQQDGMLLRASDEINAISRKLVRLDQVKSGLEPWQQTVVRKATPEAHEMVYQMDIALAKLGAHEDPTYLAMSTYPQNIDAICKNANEMEGTIRTGIQYAHAEGKMATLKLNTSERGL